MSTLNVSNITDGTDTVGTTYILNGTGKTFCNFNGQNTPSVRDSFNHSSIIDDSTGNFRLNYTSGFDNNNYCHYGTTAGTGASNGDHNFIPHSNATGNTTTQSHQLRVSDYNGNRRDCLHTMHVTVGDLA